MDSLADKDEAHASPESSDSTAGTVTRERPLYTAEVTALGEDGRGVAELDGRRIFIDGALPGERVRFHYLRKRKRSAGGRAVEILQSSPLRVTPPCTHADRCGGCRLQHLHPDAQLQFKEDLLREKLRAAGGLVPRRWLPAITGPRLHYRRRARLGVRYIPSRGGVLVGFRARASSYIIALRQCMVLDERVAGLMPALAELVNSMRGRDRIPQIEVAAGDEEAALVFRHLVAFDDAELERLAAFGRSHGLQIHLQPRGPDSVWCLHPGASARLSYRLPAHEVEIVFRPTDFIQVNGAVNRAMVDRAVALLEPRSEERILDLFCGLGNFTLPLARRAREVVGLEMDPLLVAGAEANARRNGLHGVRFHQVDLETQAAGEFWRRYRPHKVLLDPARDGAMPFLKHMPRGDDRPQRLLYISCNPATLARDAEYLVRVLGFRLECCGVVDMFPHTSHVEAMAVFERA